MCCFSACSDRSPRGSSPPPCAVMSTGWLKTSRPRSYPAIRLGLQNSRQEGQKGRPFHPPAPVAYLTHPTPTAKTALSRWTRPFQARAAVKEEARRTHFHPPTPSPPRRALFPGCTLSLQATRGARGEE